MCLIITAPQGNQIPKELLVDATNRNNDGWGIMYHDGQKIVTQKSHKPDADAIYELTRNNPHQTVVHLRMTTHGDNTPDNTHPFEIVPERLYMMHNGVIDVDVPHGSKKSDTRVVVEEYLKPLINNRPGRIHNTGFKNFLQKLIGTSSNRLVFLNDEGKLTYFNKRLGLEWKGLWCSNTYAWSLHSESKKASTYHSYFDDWRYDRRWSSADWAIDWSKDTATKHIGKGIYDDEFKWADKNVQAADDIDLDADVETEFGFIVPAWVASFLECDINDLAEQDPYELACVIENLRDTYIGAPK